MEFQLDVGDIGAGIFFGFEEFEEFAVVGGAFGVLFFDDHGVVSIDLDFDGGLGFVLNDDGHGDTLGLFGGWDVEGFLHAEGGGDHEEDEQLECDVDGGCEVDGGVF